MIPLELPKRKPAAASRLKRIVWQIEPITHYEEWKQENIYTMVKLNSFSQPHTYPRKYPVVLLKKQYRSIPVIGEIFSAFSYGGLLSHARRMEDQRPLVLKSGFPLKPLNILSFPVEKEYGKSIYRLNELKNHSPYQIYSALFAFEFAKYIAEELDCSCQEKVFRIGIISPYHVQTDLIDKLLARTRIPSNVSIQAGTAHGFQGDECEMIIALFNPPRRASSRAYVNKQNIINVAVSRARDYLVLLLPESGISSCNNLQYVCQLCRVSGCCDMFSTHGWEEIMFSSPDFLEENSFSTGHQSVNVYGEPEKRYEIRSENSSLDIQIHVDKTISIPKEP